MAKIDRPLARPLPASTIGAAAGGRGRRAGGLAVALLAACALPACGGSGGRACTRADLDRRGPVAMPAPVAVTRTRRLNGDRLEPLPAGDRPPVTAAAAWGRLLLARQAYGGGRDELLLGRFTGRGFTGVPAWVLFTSHLAQRLAPLSAPAGGAEAQPCVFVDVLTVVNAETGEIFYGSTRS
jgi:hypothetical protein